MQTPTKSPLPANNAKWATVHPGESGYLLNDLLKEVSRSFFLTLKFLPKPVRPQIGLAYLLARATDTVADTELLPVDQRLASLRELMVAIQTGTFQPFNFEPFISAQGNPSEKILLTKINQALALLHSNTGDPDRKLIQTVLETITSGQASDLTRFRNGTATAPAHLTTEAELDDYTWRVAGCVGEFWTRICVAHLGTGGFDFPGPAQAVAEGVNLEWLIQKGISYGKGLQYVNILRDIPADLKIGRCYIPSEALAAVGLKPAELLDPDAWPMFKPLFHHFLHRASTHLHDGWQYTLSLPRNWIRLRLACAWPILIGMETILKLKESNVLQPDDRVKISRSQVRKIILKSILFYPFPQRWANLIPNPFPSRT